ncbi:hypothetical protein [Amaricoccus sp.]|uniref:hypothetical protein n=1 Tax=Amaricoccus sp. TaxID=1872485 RepID=UPI001B5C1234|nr:hypothetical protein [Amaricoccus sp.]MBP7002991.1 hypothetical protein [Amaricoccus sp.]
MVSRASYDPNIKEFLSDDEMAEKAAASPAPWRKTSLATPHEFRNRRIAGGSVSDLRDTSDPVMSTARSTGGRPIVSRDVGPNDLISVNGMQMQVRIPEQMGLVTRGANGRYSSRETPSSPEGDLRRRR